MVGWYSRFIERESEIKLPLLQARPDFTREFTV